MDADARWTTASSSGCGARSNGRWSRHAHIPQFRHARVLAFLTDAWPNRSTAGKSWSFTDLAVFSPRVGSNALFACRPRGRQSGLARRRTSQSLAVPGYIGIRRQYSKKAATQTAECGTECEEEPTVGVHPSYLMPARPFQYSGVAYGGGSMVGAFLRREVSALAILSTLVLLPVASVNAVLAAPVPRNGSASSFKYAGAFECPSPPAGWDPTTATVDQLHYYGLPLPLASSGTEYLKWVDHIRHAIHHVCPKGVASKYHTDTFHHGAFGSNGD